MIKAALAVYMREMLILKRRIAKQIPSWAVAPLLYMVAFGYAVGKSVEVGGHSYLEFLLPGLMAMTSMTQAFGLASEINISRFYWHTFEEFQTSPISSLSYVLGEFGAGVIRAILAGLVILLLGGLFGIQLQYNFCFWAAFLLCAGFFAAIAIALAMLVRSHADQAMLSSFVITPMAFLGGTFFPLENLPVWAQKILWLLPLTHASTAMRAEAFGEPSGAIHYIILLVLTLLAFVWAVFCVKRAKI